MDNTSPYTTIDHPSDTESLPSFPETGFLVLFHFLPPVSFPSLFPLPKKEIPPGPPDGTLAKDADTTR